MTSEQGCKEDKRKTSFFHVGTDARNQAQEGFCGLLNCLTSISQSESGKVWRIFGGLVPKLWLRRQSCSQEVSQGRYIELQKIKEG